MVLFPKELNDLSHKKVVISVTFVVLFVPHLVSGASKFQTLLPSNSVATSDDALATFFNPAGLAAGRGSSLYYFRTYAGDSDGDDAFFVSTPKTGFHMEFGEASDDVEFRRYTFASGSRLSGSIYWGTGYSWINSDDDGYDKFSSWSVGLMFRRRYLSFGAVARDLNRPSLLEEKRTYDLGIALRPGTWRLTFSVDARKVEDSDGLDFNYALEIRPVRGTILRASVNADKSFDIRFGLTLGQVGVGTYNRFDGKKHQEGVGYLHLSSLLQTKVRTRRKIFLETKLGDIEKTFRIAKHDPNVVGAVIGIGSNDYGIGRLQGVRKAVKDFKSAGKKTIFYAHKCSTGNYLVAAACDQIILHPSGEVRLIGLRSELSFYKGTLDRLGMRANLEHIGDYKSATNVFTRESMSDAQREAQNSILDDLYDQVCESISNDRDVERNGVKMLIDHGPYTARQAVESRVVDRLAYRSELEEISREVSGRNHSLVGAKKYLNTGLRDHDWKVPLPRIAIIEANGMMVTGESFSDPFTGARTMGAATIARTIRRVREDDSIKATVLRINSGGGLVLAADIIWRELMRLKQIKPLIVSMGDVAGSGGYYIAVPAHTIVAQPGTITGSIGVIGGKFSLKQFYDKIGLRKEIVKRGRHSNFYSDYGDYTPEERVIVRKQIAEIYDDFIKKVAESRNLSEEEVDRIGQGRIWTGKQAKKNGLVDRLGGIDLALSIARKRAGLGKQQVEIIRLPRENWVTQWTSAFNAVKEFAGRAERNRSRSVLNLMRQCRTFLLMPYAIKVND